MKKLLLVMFTVLIAVFMFSGCNQQKLESGWKVAKKTHGVLKGAGKAAIENDVVSEETAEKLKKLNSAVETGGGLTEKVYTRVKLRDEPKEAN